MEGLIKIKEIIIRENLIDYYKDGFPLIIDSSLGNQKLEQGELINFLDKNYEFVAKGYYGEQNKGKGWILTLKDVDIDLKFFINKFATALNKRVNYFESDDTNAFRLFNGEGDGIGGITIDIFDYYLLVTWYNEGIYKYRDIILEAIKNVTYIKGLYEKRRFDKAGKYIEEPSFTSGEKAPEPLVVKENNVNYAIYLDDGAMVGIFLDQKEVRNYLKEISFEKTKLLNMFSYTGAFSMAAAFSGAITTSVDLANRSLEKTTENFEVNNIDVSSQEIIVMDVFDYFDVARKQERKFDIIVIDPPSYANSKKRRFTVQKNYGELIEKSIDLVEKNGIIVASTNCSLMPIKKFKSQIDEAFKNKMKSYKLLKTYRLPADFATNDKYDESNYLKVLVMKVK